MEASLATDSFSFRWLPHNSLPSTDFHGDFPEQSPHENDHLKTTTHTFTFDVDSVSTTDHHSSTPLPLSQPDTLFSSGIFMSPLTHHHVSTSNPVPPISTKNQKSIFLTNFGRFSRKFLHKCECFLCPSCPTGAGKTRRRRGKRVDDLNRRAKEVTTPETVSPRMSTVWSDSTESSIYEAILYCKRSCGQ